MAFCLTRIVFEPDNPLRYAGNDWPAQAETMIGIPRLHNIIQCVSTVVHEDIPGDVAECGVWRGGATIMMKAVLSVCGFHERQVFVCDSFEGLPPPDDRYPADMGDKLHTFNDVLAVPEEVVRANFQRYNLLDDKVRFIKGFFEHSLPGPIEELSVLRLDGDMYSSTIHTLDALYPKVTEGGFVIVDDFGGHGNGCQQAVERYREVHRIVEPYEYIADSGAIFWRKS